MSDTGPLAVSVTGLYFAWFGVHYWRDTKTHIATDPIKAVLTGKPIPTTSKGKPPSASIKTGLTDSSSSSSSSGASITVPSGAAMTAYIALGAKMHSSGTDTPDNNKALAQQMMGTFDTSWNGQFPDLDKLWTQESSWKTTIENQSSGAYGIPQSLPGDKMAAAGADWKTNPATQILWGLSYIKKTYQSPAKAWAHEQSNNWY